MPNRDYSSVCVCECVSVGDNAVLVFVFLYICMSIALNGGAEIYEVNFKNTITNNQKFRNT